MPDRLYSRVLALARAFAAGAQQLDAAVARGAMALGRPPHMVRPVAERYLATFSGRTRPRVREIVDFLIHDRAWKRRKRADQHTTRRGDAIRWTIESSSMQPVLAAATWNVPSLVSVAALADWLELTAGELDWFSDVKARTTPAPSARLHHYHYALREKRHGGVRLIEAPQARLKALQRRILSEILEQVPSYYTAAHGFVKGRSARTFAAEHVAQRVVLRMDLQDFFPRIGGARVQAVFRALGYPEVVADLLGGLCTNVTPHAVFDARRWPALTAVGLAEARRVYARPHLPQGAPTSPALANLCAFRLDARLTGLADWAGATYSRYADDLAFSGGDEFARRVERYATQIAVIAQEEGWQVQHHKTRVMRRGTRQQLVGLVVNERVNVSRADFDTLKATLTNCARYGPDTQNRDRHPDFRAHLAGRVSWVASVTPAKGQRLRAIFEQIDWTDRAE